MNCGFKYSFVILAMVKSNKATLLTIKKSMVLPTNDDN